ncbi:MAG: metal ABC transporter permease [Lentisphaerae bacterium]|nr:metal ABC transporter permease [Lentisphaerota bacterium]
MLTLCQDEYFRNALAACVFGGGGIAIIGVFLTLMQIPFLGICMAHAAFLGAIIGLLLGQAPFAWAMLACAVAGLAVGPLAEKTEASSNVVLSIIFSATMGLSLILMALIPGPKTEALNLMWGSLLTVSQQQVWILGAVLLGLLVCLRAFYKEIVAVLFNRELAAASGLPAALIYYSIIMLGGLTIGATLDMIGGLLIFALLVNPANTASLLSCRLAVILPLAVALSISSCLIGLWASYLWDIPTGGSVVLVSSGLYLVAFLISPRRYQRQALAHETTSAIN